MRGRTFFFGDYQSARTERSLSQTATVPTARMKAGDLSELTGNMVATNPFVPAGCVDAVAKTINRSCFDSSAARLLSLFPAPNVPGTGFFNNNFISNGILNNNVDQFDVRVDHRSARAAIRCLRATASRTPTATSRRCSRIRWRRATSTSDILNRGQSAVAGWSRVFGANIFNELRGAFNKVRSDVIHLAFGMDVNAQYGIRGVPTDPRFYGGLPHIAIARVQRIGGPFFRPQFQDSAVFSSPTT